MYRSIPVGNKLCAERNRQRNQELHMKRLNAMKPQVDTSEPGVVHLDHLRNNLKREQLLEERYFEIDRENKILLQKMSDIMRTSSYTNERSKSGPPSLNRDLRKMELMRITQENQKILSRIQKAQPIYNHVEWEDSYRRSATYLKNKCEYPPMGRDGGKMSSRGLIGASLVGTKPSTAGDDMRATASSARSGGFGSARSDIDAGKPRSAPGGMDDMPSGRRHVLKSGKNIGSRHYLVEMVTDGRALAISAYDGDTQRTLELVVSETNHRRLYRDANGDYDLIAQRLRVEGNDLTIDTGSP
jgi:E3 ubiquitin-protein ligase TRIP12